MPDAPYRILVVEDDTPSRMLLRRVLQPEGYKVDLATNGEEAVKMIEENKYEAVITDWMMPKMDGIELINQIRKIKKPAPVILMITALASEEAKNKALLAGADDYIAKPIQKQEVLLRIKNALTRSRLQPVGSARGGKAKKQTPSFSGVAIAASTGGPNTLMEVFKDFSPPKNAAYFIVLHGPVWMLESFTARLGELLDNPVHLGEDMMPVEAGHIYVAPGEKHMIVRAEPLVLRLTDDPPQNFVKPAADPLFRSVSEVFGKQSLGVVFTGMGHDGSIGCGYIKAVGGQVIVQDPKTAILPSMPESVLRLGLANESIPLDKFSVAFTKYAKNL